MKEMGGSIRASSEGWGTGATFILTLPLVQAARPDEPAPEAASPALLAEAST